MKTKFILRLFLCLVAIWPALIFCGTFALAFFVSLILLKFADALFTLPFLSCIIIYVLFLIDTIKGLKSEH